MLTRLARAEPLLVVAAAPLLIFPRGFLPWVGLGLLLLGWLFRSLWAGSWFVRTPLDRPIAAVLLMSLVGLYVSVDLALSLPKFYGILLGVLVFYATVSNVSTQRDFHVGLGLLIASLVAISFLGLVGADWAAGKYPALQQLYNTIPRLVRGVQSSFGPSSGFHPNELGGTLAFLLPLPLVLVLSVPLSRLQTIVLGSAILTGFGVLLLSASRSALMALSVTLLMVLIWRYRRTGLILIAAVAIVFGTAIVTRGEDALNLLLKLDALGSSNVVSFQGRLELWDRATTMIGDFPFTGIGLNTFPIVVNALYPLILEVSDDLVPHAHNIFLQVAVDLGLAGLLGFVGLWASAMGVGWHIYRRAGSSERNVATSRNDTTHFPLRASMIGLLLGLLSYLIFGLTDAITLGAKPTVLLWLMMGLIVSARRLVLAPEAGSIRLADSVSSMGKHAHSSVTSIYEAGYRRHAVQLLDHPEERELNQPSSGSARRSLAHRAVSFLLHTAREIYWMIAFLLVGLAYLVVGMNISGWIP